MVWMVVVIQFSFIGQPDGDAGGLKPYVFHLRREKDLVRALVVESELENRSKPFLMVLIDEPWRPEEERWRKLRRTDFVEEPSPELTSLRRRRIDEGWSANGGRKVLTPEGPRWVLKSDYDLVQRARALEAKAFPAEIVEGRAIVLDTETSGDEGPGFFSMWGLHIAISGGAVVLCAAVIWATMIRSRWSAVGP